MITLDRRRRRLLAGLLGAGMLAAALVLLPLAISGDGSGEPGSAVAVIPEAELQEGDDSKTDSYRRGGISDYWDSLGEESAGAEWKEGTLTEPDAGDSRPDTPKGRRRPPAASVDDLFGDCRITPSGETARREEYRSAEPSQGKPADSPSVPSEAQAAETAPPRTPVKRSGAVSSLDEDVPAEPGNGFSTLDGADQWVGTEAGKPYRCMFTRDAKVKNGQRITVRLLEDLVAGGVHIPRNTHLQGVVSISDRMEVSITSLDVGGRIISLRFEAYDTDGGKGIYCSELSRTRKVVTEQGVSTVSSALDSRLGRVARDAAALGASIVRNKAGEATVSVPAGYPFYIIEESR